MPWSARRCLALLERCSPCRCMEALFRWAVSFAAKNWSKAACLKGVPMGGDLSEAPEGKAPTFQIKASGIPMERILIAFRWSRVG